jgi:predicted amidohydrolase YtcJ
MADFGSHKMQLGALKSFADGSLGSTTAWFFDPYSDAPDTRGIPSPQLLQPAEMYEEMRRADKAGLQLAVQAIGDRAIKPSWACLKSLKWKTAPQTAACASQAMTRSLLKRGIFAGDKCCACSLDAGTVLAFGSDWFVAPISRLMGIYAAATRRTLDGKHPNGCVPEQNISVAEAVHAYTMGSAYASFEEGRKGRPCSVITGYC